MTVSSQQSEVPYTGDGVTRVFPVPFYFLQNSDIQIVINDVFGNIYPAVQNVDYTVTGAGNEAGGTVTFGVAPLNLLTITIQRIVPATQLTDYQPNDDFPAETHERALDKLTMLVQQSFSGLSRALTRPLGKPYYDAQGRNIKFLAEPIDVQDATTKNWVSTYFAALLDATTGPTNTTTGILYDATTLFDYLRFGVARTVDSIAALRLLSGSRNQRAFVFGYYAKGDGGGGQYYIDQSDTTSLDNGGSIIVAVDGARWKLSGATSVSVRQFGAKGDGVADDTSAFVKAVTAHKKVTMPAGTYKLTDEVFIPRLHCLYGDGLETTFIYVPLTFNLSALGVIRHEGENEITDFQFLFELPAVGVTRATYPKYPWAIYGNGATNSYYDMIRVCGAYNGICALGNSGGCSIGRLEIGAINKGLQIGTPLDFFHIDSLHFWVFGFIARSDLMTIYYDQVTIAMQTEKADGLSIDKLSAYASRVIWTSTDVPTLPISIGNVQLDGTGATWEQAGSSIMVSTMYSTKGDGGIKPDVKITGGRLSVGIFEGASTTGFPTIESSGKIDIAQGRIQSLISGISAVRILGGKAGLKGVELVPNNDASDGQAFISVLVTGRISMEDCEFTGRTTKPVVGIYAPGSHRVVGNDFNGSSIGYDAAYIKNILVASNQNRGNSPQAPTVPASGTAFTNSFLNSYRVSIFGGAYTIVVLNGTRTVYSGASTSAPISVYVQPGDTVTITYTTVPVWTWIVDAT